MSTPVSRQTRKRLATRQKISDVATRLFIAHGFDDVTVDQIAEAADVSRMTVFNHFARKEDMFFDLDEQVREDLLKALHTRSSKTSPVEALRLFAHQAVAEKRLYVGFFEPQSDQFMRTVLASPALRARVRAIRDELTALLAAGLAATRGRSSADAEASLGAAMLVATWDAAVTAALQVHRRKGSKRAANQVFLALVDRGSAGVTAALAGTPYV